MSNKDNELRRQFHALRGINEDTDSEISSSVQVLRGERQQQPLSQPVLQPLSPTEHRQQQQQQQQQQYETKSKKKCRGNRKKQRYRRQLYEKGFSSDEVNKRVEERFGHRTEEQLQQQIDQITSEEYCSQDLKVYIPLERIALPEVNSGQSVDSIEMGQKRKRFVLTPTPTTETRTILDKSLSQLSISQENPNKKKITTNNQQLNKANKQLSIKSTEKDKPHYLKVPDRILKQLLANAIDNGHKIIQCLDTKDKIDFIRQIAELKHNFYYKELQRQLWHEYYTLSTKDNNWEVTITKGYANQHNTYRMYRPRKSFIEQRRTTIARQMEQIEHELQEYLLKLKESSKQWQPSTDLDVLLQVIDECVKNGQRRLKDEFSFKKEMLTLDWNDNQLITKFYNLKPNEEQIQLAKTIWQTTADELRVKEQLEILCKRITLKRLPAQTDKMVNELLTDNQKSLSNPFLEQEQRASFASRCSKTIIQCKLNLMIVQIDEFETIIRRHKTILTNLQAQLSPLNKEKSNIYTIEMTDTIEERRQAMIKRFIRMREHKLKTFFDEAPTVDNNIL